MNNEQLTMNNEQLTINNEQLGVKVNENAEYLAWVLTPPVHGVKSLFGFDDLGDKGVSRTGATLQIVDNSSEV